VTVSHRLGRTAGFGKVVVMLAGGVTAALVTWLVRDRGTVAMWVAGGTFAVFVPAAYADSSLTWKLPPTCCWPRRWQCRSECAACRCGSCGPPGPAGRGDRDEDLGVVPLLIIVAFLWHRDGRTVGDKVASNSSPSDDDPGSPRCAATR
jgi:hypothetical protein